MYTCQREIVDKSSEEEQVVPKTDIVLYACPRLILHANQDTTRASDLAVCQNILRLNRSSCIFTRMWHLSSFCGAITVLYCQRRRGCCISHSRYNQPRAIHPWMPHSLPSCSQQRMLCCPRIVVPLITSSLIIVGLLCHAGPLDLLLSGINKQRSDCDLMFQEKK